MSRRIEIQLTSRIADDQWSWRAAGARQPKGVVDASLVPDGIAEGTVLKADVEISIEGIEVIAISAPTVVAEKPKKAQTIELLGSGREQAGVSWSLAPKAKRSGRREDGDRREGGGRDGRGGPGGRDAKPRGDRPEGGRGGPRAGGPRGPGGPGGGRGPGGPGGGRGDARGGRPAAPAQSMEYRNAMLAGLAPAQLPIAEQLLRGGIPAVRQAIDAQNAQARTDGQPPASEEAIMAIAEELLPLTALAAWKDRAHSAQVAGKETRLRDLRAIVSSSRSVSMDDEGRAMAKALHESLDQRAKGLSDEWVTRMTSSLDEGRVADALRASARAPEPSTRCPADVATRLAETASAAMTAETDPREWLSLLDAVSESPVRRNVKPVGIPPEADVEAAARNAAGLVPALAKLLGLRIPPPPPRRVVHQRRDETRRPDGA